MVRAAHGAADDGWLQTLDLEGTVLVTVVGKVTADRSSHLWSCLEEAVEIAAGRAVIADLTHMTSFDEEAIEVLAEVARASARRHLDLCVLVLAKSLLEHRLDRRQLSRNIPIYACRLGALWSAAITDQLAVA